MDMPHRSARPIGSLPKINVPDSIPTNRSRMSSSRSNSYGSNTSPPSSSIAMPIPNAREPPPPPLPPPRYIRDIAEGNNGHDLAWRLQNSHEDPKDWGRSVASVPPSSSLYGSFASLKNDTKDERHEHARRGSSIATIKSADFRDQSSSRSDEGYASFTGISNGLNRVNYQESTSANSGFQSSVHAGYQTNAQAYDKSLLQKLDAVRAIDNKTPPRGLPKAAFSSSANETSPSSRMFDAQRNAGQLKALSLPSLAGRPTMLESPLRSRWAEPTPSGTSPRYQYPPYGFQGQFEFRSPSENTESDRSPLSYTLSGCDSLLSGGDDHFIAPSRSRENSDRCTSPEQDAGFQMESSGFRRLHIEDHSSRHDSYSPGSSIGQKRRASSPPSDDGPALHTVGSSSDLFRRRESVSRTSPAPRFHSSSGSVSSTASAPRSSSYVSNVSLAVSSATSMSSYGRLSPGGMDLSDSPYTTSLSLNPSPRGSLSMASHQRTLSSETRPPTTSRRLLDNGPSRHAAIPKMQGIFMCECCPKKPKKFDSQQDLTAHEQEKQYECGYCKNKFKNKNEAERHQNSLHIRRSSWSCASLSGYAAAFHNSPNRPNEADTCGYCGDDFPRSGISTPFLVATAQDWETRISHLQEMHKFGECNQAKKFFRADHFRQHLKHSHAGTSGKWTNMLETACQREEPLPEPRVSERVSPGGSRVDRITEEEEDL